MRLLGLLGAIVVSALLWTAITDTAAGAFTRPADLARGAR